jgi:hypothetical protein
MKIKIVFILSLAFGFVLPAKTQAEGQKPRALQAIEFLSGYQWGELLSRNWYKVHEKSRAYQLIPFLVDFDFNLKNLTRKINFQPQPLLQFQVEPFISYVFSPDDNIETGLSFFFKLGLLPETSRFQPYLKAGPGLLYMSQHTREQSTQFNFTETAGVGMHFFYTKNSAFSLEGRFRHLSNADIKKPNHGINTYSLLLGISYRFD